MFHVEPEAVLWRSAAARSGRQARLVSRGDYGRARRAVLVNPGRQVSRGTRASLEFLSPQVRMPGRVECFMWNLEAVFGRDGVLTSGRPDRMSREELQRCPAVLAPRRLGCLQLVKG